MTSLTSPAITELTVEDGALNAIGEWLRLFFTGSLQAVGDNAPVFFPAVNLAFNQSPQVQPLYVFGKDEDTTIRVIMIPRNEITESNDTVLYAGKLAISRVLFNFYVSAKHAGKGAQAQESAQNVAKLLKAILTNPDSRFPLANLGILELSPEPPRVISGPDYAQRLVACGAQLQYPVRFGGQPVPPAGTVVTISTAAWPMRILYVQPQTLIAGEYLLGDFTALCNLQLNNAGFTAFAPQVSPVILELEVDGTLAGLQLMIPVGSVNQEMVGSVDLSTLKIIPGQKLRWKIISAPGVSDSAWRVSISMMATPVAG